MWHALKELFPQDRRPDEDEHALELAVAALLVHASVADGRLSPTEDERVAALLASRFSLSHDAVVRLMAEARAAEAKAVDLYKFTRVITERFDEDGRRGLIEMLWEVALADGRLDPFEENIIWRVAELIGVSTRDRVALRHKVEERLANARQGPWGSRVAPERT